MPAFLFSIARFIPACATPNRNAAVSPRRHPIVQIRAVGTLLKTGGTSPRQKKRADICRPFRFAHDARRYAFFDSIQRLIFSSSTSSGTEPSFSTSAWNSRTSNLSPSAFSDLSRISWIFNAPIL